MRRIQAPIFLNCFSRGGSNILWNLFLTHPDVCSPILETLEIFRMGLRKPTLAGYKAAWLSRQWRLFDQWYLHERKPLNDQARRFIDETLYAWKLKTLTDVDMKYKYEDEVYTLDEVQQARLVAKNNNGLAFLSDALLDLYPEASFIALIRHPVPLYESHKRRRITTSVEAFADFYRRMAERMVADQERFARYHIVRFEDVLADPVGTMRRLHALVGLDADKVRKVRLKAKPHLHADGRHATAYDRGRHYWFNFDDVCDLLEPKINAYHAQRLSATERETLHRLLDAPLRALSYSPVLST